MVLTQGNTRRYTSLTQGHTIGQGKLVVLLPLTTQVYYGSQPQGVTQGETQVNVNNTEGKSRHVYA